MSIGDPSKSHKGGSGAFFKKTIKWQSLKFESGRIVGIQDESWLKNKRGQKVSSAEATTDLSCCTRIFFSFWNFFILALFRFHCFIASLGPKLFIDGFIVHYTPIIVQLTWDRFSDCRFPISIYIRAHNWDPIYELIQYWNFSINLLLAHF